MGNDKISLSGIGVSNLCVLRPGDPPIDFPQLGFAAPNGPQITQAFNNGPGIDTTYWQYQDWQPS